MTTPSLSHPTRIHTSYRLVWFLLTKTSCNAGFPTQSQPSSRLSVLPPPPFPPASFALTVSASHSPPSLCLCGGYRISVTSNQRCWARLRQAALAERIAAECKLLYAPQRGSPIAQKLNRVPDGCLPYNEIALKQEGGVF